MMSESMARERQGEEMFWLNIFPAAARLFVVRLESPEKGMIDTGVVELLLPLSLGHTNGDFVYFHPDGDPDMHPPFSTTRTIWRCSSSTTDICG